jgi:hypothetical protein
LESDTVKLLFGPYHPPDTAAGSAGSAGNRPVRGAEDWQTFPAILGCRGDTRHGAGRKGAVADPIGRPAAECSPRKRAPMVAVDLGD